MDFFALAMLLLCLILVLGIYNARQAQALNGMRLLAEDLVAMQVRDRRKKAAAETTIDNPLDWLSRQITPHLPEAIQFEQLSRTVPEVKALELTTKDGRRVVVSPYDQRALEMHDSRLRSLKGDLGRAASMMNAPLLRKGWGAVQTVSLAMGTQGETFDIEAGAAGRALKMDWGEPSRLWVYVMKR